MKQYEIEDLGTVYRLEPGDDGPRAISMMLDSGDDIAFDTETSSLEIYAPDFEVRLAQLGTSEVAFVWEPADFPELVRIAATTRPVWYWNADFDTRVIDHAFGVTLEDTAPFVQDAVILARLIDSRGKKDGGVGHGLKEQAEELLGLEVADARKKVMEAAKKYKIRSEAEAWKRIPTDDETYVKYAGQDVMLTARLGKLYREGIQRFNQEEQAALAHAVAYCISTMNRRGLRLDRPYAEEALSRFQSEFDANEAKLAAFGIEPTKTGNYSTSRAGLIAKFEALGVQFTEYTPAGAPKLDDEILTKIADRDDVASEIARTVLAAKAAQKSMGFIRGFLEAADPNDRVHPTINPLGTLTGRMSCSNPNLQNLTRDAKEIRGCFVAEPGHVLLSVDYSAVEWRVAAAVTNDANMKRVFAEGGDIHADVARIVFGPDFTKAQRQQCKSVGLGRLYGGGIDALTRQSGLPRHKVEEAVAAIDSLYPGIKETVQRDYETIDGPTPVELLSGRRVIVDSAHKALNVRCQGFACDLLKYAILRLFDKGYGQYILLPVHDELIFSVPKDEAQEMLAEIQEIMRCEVNGVSIEADGEILGERWRKA